ncbi:ATP-binding domain-containing protein [Luteolibacter pohnpeiensis]|uniref:DNA 3'-5' helicase II n=1 Tax=Luteolibacter pohnpeiensis TaxID=454153 RepID=A0A934S8W8_9BACT|nr:3'-5' exonuclease [Luteolibacter pohnpeiensis]MBK1880983.1 ATP-binding domain-containing protein [Luteolibacter pohnpeiensis]
MKNTWWTNLEDLDVDQEKVLDLPPSGKHVIFGPPGCGKTNLLLLRAKYLYGKEGFKNILFLTYTGCLADFIRSGLNDQKFFKPDQVQTFWSWARSHISTYYPQGLADFESLFIKNKDKKIENSKDNKERKNKILVELLESAYAKAPTHILYDAVFIDEAQDLTKEQIVELSRLAPVVTIAGDDRQGLYGMDGLSVQGFKSITLEYHYRIGKRICEVADKILPPKDGNNSLLDYCLYSEEKNASDADIFSHATRNDQYRAILDRLQTQLRAFPDELLGVILPTNGMIEEFKSYLKDSEFFEITSFHSDEGVNNSFRSDRPIHVLTIHAAKGTEFRAVHIAGGEEIKFPMNRREVSFTAITRAKTSLSLHYSGQVMPFIASAFAKTSTITKKDLFS